MASQHSDDELPQNPQQDYTQDSDSSESEDDAPVSQPKSALKKAAPAAAPTKPYLPGASPCAHCLRLALRQYASASTRADAKNP